MEIEHQKKMSEIKKKFEDEKNKMDQKMENYINNKKIQKEQRQKEHDNEMNRIKQQNQMEIYQMNDKYNIMRQNLYNQMYI
jgi:hypothetical protein